MYLFVLLFLIVPVTESVDDDINCMGIYGTACGSGVLSKTSDCDYLSHYMVGEDGWMNITVLTHDVEKSWAGIGWSPKKEEAMTVGRAFILLNGSIDEGSLKEFQLKGNEKPQQMPGQSSLQVISIVRMEGKLILEFRRPLKPEGESRGDWNRACFHWLYPTKGGPMHNGTTMLKHTETPVVGKEKICPGKCFSKNEPDNSDDVSFDLWGIPVIKDPETTTEKPTATTTKGDGKGGATAVSMATTLFFALPFAYLTF